MASLIRCARTERGANDGFPRISDFTSGWILDAPAFIGPLIPGFSDIGSPEIRYTMRLAAERVAGQGL